MSKRKLIKQKVEEILTLADITGDRVFTNRKKADFNQEYPMIEIYSYKGSNKRVSRRDNHYERVLDLVVKVINESKTVDDFDLSASLDDYSDLIEKELMKNKKLDGLALDIEIGDFEEAYENLRVQTGAQGTIFKIAYEESL